MPAATPNITIMLMALLGLSCMAVFVAVAGGALFLLFRRPRRRTSNTEPDLHIAIADFICEGPPSEGPQLRFHHLPVRMVALVLAPVGRDGPVLNTESLQAALEFATPGLGDVFRSHQPEVRRWPFQLSSEGFIHVFFRNVCLPNDDGRGSPWCSIAGKLQVGDDSFLLGLICCAAASNSLTQTAASQSTDWLDVLRVCYPETGAV